jgi:hypothetical protein
LGNGNNPAFVYAFSTDSSNTSFVHHFPRNDNESALLDYRENLVAVPNDSYWIQLDDRVGEDILIVLYSHNELNIDEIGNRFLQTKGDIATRVATSVGENYISANEMDFSRDSMTFSAESENKNGILALILVIHHE